jgi:GcpE protein
VCARACTAVAQQTTWRLRTALASPNALCACARVRVRVRVVASCSFLFFFSFFFWRAALHQQVTQQIQEKTGHLPGVSIAIMGCIVNGVGEMADADFGYVGGAPGKVC